jgi:pyridoxamine 5'-phosphate oxidase family protein
MTNDDDASVFTQAEIEYMTEVTMARLATVGPNGQPHVAPVTYHYNPEEDAIDVGGVAFGETKKWRDAKRNPRVTILVDDVRPNPWRARGLEVRGNAEIHETGGDTINPRFPNFVPQFMRIRPTRIVGWGLEEGGVGGNDFEVNARSIG